MPALKSDTRWIPTAALLGAAGLLFWTFWFDPLSVEDVSRWWSLPSGANWAAFAAALGSLVGGTALVVGRPGRDQPLPMSVLIVTLASAAIGVILVGVDWILTKISSIQLIVEGSHALLLTMFVADAGAALWLVQIGRSEQRRSREQLLAMAAWAESRDNGWNKDGSEIRGTGNSETPT